MGFFSWETCDSKESIPAAASGREMKPVYLLQPNGEPPIKEPCYEGSGWFGEVNAYAWLADMNVGPLGLDIPETDGDFLSLGISLGVGVVLRDTVTGEYWRIFHTGPRVIKCWTFAGTYADIIPEFGKTANDLVEEGRMEMVPIADAVGLPFPLKFSFDPNAVYEDFPESARCPHQGYFYDDDSF